MPSYLIECYLPRSRSGELPATVTRLRRETAALTAEGTPVRHLRSTFVPSDEVCLHLLEGASAATVRRAARRASLEPSRVVRALPIQSTHPSGGAS